MKRFLRAGARVLLTWPTTMLDAAEKMAAASSIAGVIPVDVPLVVQGPSRRQWQELAIQTLQLANQVDSLERIIDVTAHDPERFESLGDYLKGLALAFNHKKLALQRETKRPTTMTVVVSETSGHGILSSLTSSRRHGFLDPNALLQASKTSEVGRWWDGHGGLLVQTIIALDAHVLSVSPPLSLAVIRRYGPDEVKREIAELGVTEKTPSDVTAYSARSDLGRRLAGEQRAVAEARGNPGEGARKAFAEFSGRGSGFKGGRDKVINKAFAQALRMFHEGDLRIPTVKIGAETALPHIPSLVPDVSVDVGELVNCLEFTYRKGDFVNSANRGAIAAYCLVKLKNYARELGWFSEVA